jgi:hypothetical protein
MKPDICDLFAGVVSVPRFRDRCVNTGSSFTAIAAQTIGQIWMRMKIAPHRQ